ncbi:hypothetical protein GCM10009863_22250 [Streptomyces axinellae]|uniref:Uncharacterized protein n=1 Tax=Streptomyces axinellae TaxID=552788 RepID=A0ABN3Q2L9_9ACTN
MPDTVCAVCRHGGTGEAPRASGARPAMRERDVRPAMCEREEGEWLRLGRIRRRPTPAVFVFLGCADLTRVPVSPPLVTRIERAGRAGGEFRTAGPGCHRLIGTVPMRGVNGDRW